MQACTNGRTLLTDVIRQPTGDASDREREKKKHERGYFLQLHRESAARVRSVGPSNVVPRLQKCGSVFQDLAALDAHI